MSGPTLAKATPALPKLSNSLNLVKEDVFFFWEAVKAGMPPLTTVVACPE